MLNQTASVPAISLPDVNITSFANLKKYVAEIAPVAQIADVEIKEPSKDPAPCDSENTDVTSLYIRWRSANLDDKESHLKDLLKGVHDFAVHVLWKEFDNLLNDIDDVAQNVTVKIWQKIESFRGESKFSTWAHKIIRRTAIDSCRSIKNKRECQLNDKTANKVALPGSSGSRPKPRPFKNWCGESIKSCDWNYFYADWLTQNNEKDSRLNQDRAEKAWLGLGIGSTDVETDKVECSKENPVIDIQYSAGAAGTQAGDDADPEIVRKYISKQEKDAHENEINTKIDLERALGRLHPDDKRLIDLRADGLTGKQLAEVFQCSEKQILNRCDRVSESLYHQVHNFSVLIHTCSPDIQSVYELQPDTKYIQNIDELQPDTKRTFKRKKSYRALPKLCRCKREVAIADAAKMVESGSVNSVYKLKNGKIISYDKVMWAERAVKVPRVSASNVSIEKYADGDKASRANLDTARDLSNMMLRRLMTGADEDVRHPVSGEIVPLPTARPVVESEDVWRGETIFTSWTDQRTVGGYDSPSQATRKKAKDSRPYGTLEHLEAMQRENKSLNQGCSLRPVIRRENPSDGCEPSS